MKKNLVYVAFQINPNKLLKIEPRNDLSENSDVYLFILYFQHFSDSFGAQNRIPFGAQASLKSSIHNQSLVQYLNIHISICFLKPYKSF